MILTALDRVPVADFLEQTGWEAKPQGMCRGEVCVPAPGALHDDGTIDVRIAAERLGMPIEHDDAHGVWAVGPATLGGHALSTAEAADPVLLTRDGEPFRLSSLRGRKVVLAAWASY